MKNQFTESFNPRGINTGNPLECTTCPVEAIVLRRMYEVDLLSLKQIGNCLGCNYGSVYKWLKKLGVQIRPAQTARALLAGYELDPFKVNKGNPLEFTPCPITPAQLRRLYHELRMTLDEIGSYCGKLLNRNRAFDGTFVRNWMILCDIPTRNTSQSLKIAHKVKPQRFVAAIQTWRDSSYSKTERHNHLSKAATTKGVKNAARKRIKARIKVECAFCKEPIFLPECRIRQSSLHYCDIDCCKMDARRRNKAIRLERKQAQLAQAAKDARERESARLQEKFGLSV